MSVIFDDLGIDYSSMMTDPENFQKQVFEAADELKKVLKGSNNLEDIVRDAEDDFKWDKNTILSDIYELADKDMSMGSCMEFAKRLRKLASDIEYIAKDKALQQIILENPMDKSMAFEMYKDLRAKYNTWLDAMETLDLYHDGAKLPPMQGNYGGDQRLKRYGFLFEGDDMAYRNPLSVIRRLNKEQEMDLENMNLMDLVDFLRANPNLGVQVAEYTK